MLKQLLSKLEKQQTEGLFEYSVVVVDNDTSESARQTVESCTLRVKTSVSYYVEPEQNIALARNKAVEGAEGDLIAFIDDDELPPEHWLLNLYKAIDRYDHDGVLGPVKPIFDKEPPSWVLKGRFFDRPTHPTGQVLEWNNTRTGNALVKRSLFKKEGRWFDPAYGSGGEDRDFFRRKIAEGSAFVWCNEAPVYEIVPSERWKRSVMARRALLRGKVAFENAASKPLTLIKSIVAITGYTLGLPILLVFGQHIFMKYLVKDCDHFGKVLACFGVDLVKEKYVTG